MKFYTIIAFLSLALVTNGFAQEQSRPVLVLEKGSVSAHQRLLGMNAIDAKVYIPHKTQKVVEGKQYPLIKETIQIEDIDVLRIKDNRDWDHVSKVYLFIDSSDRVCRLHIIYNDLPAKEREKIAADLIQRASAQLDKTDKKHTTYIGKANNTDYIFTWAKDKNKKASYLLVTDYGYKIKMLNYLVNGGTLPDDGIFTPAPSK